MTEQGPERGPAGVTSRGAGEYGAPVDRLAFLAAASEALSRSLDLEETLTRLVRLVVPALADTCSIELLIDDRLELAAISDRDPETERVFRGHADRSGYEENLAYPPRRVVSTGRPMLVPEVPAEVYREFVEDEDQLDFLLNHRAATGMCVPMHARGRVVGAMSFARLAGKPPYGDDDLLLALDLGHRAALAIDSAQQFAAAAAEVQARRRAEEVQRFLADVTRTLIAELDYESNLRTLAELAVPFLADLCLIDVADGPGIRRIAARHRDPSAQPLVDELEREYPPDPSGQHPAVAAIRSGEITHAEVMSEERWRTMTRDENHYLLVRKLGFRSYICVPLIARGRALGAFTLISCSPDRRYVEADVQLARDVAGRAALVLDNARLLAERSHVAEVLQRTLLPAALPDIPGVELAARYRAMGDSIEVGGDFYDAFPAGDGAWILAVGDVCGKGADAAALTGVVRHSLRAVATTQPGPGAIVRAVHDILVAESTGDGKFCTMVCAVLRPSATGVTVSVVCAGHPAPLVRRVDGTVTEVVNRGWLLGTQPETHIPEPTLIELGPGDVVVFYTDGVTEARRAGTIFGDARLRSTLQSCAPEAPAIVDALLGAVDAFTSGETRDDIAVLAAGVRPQP